MERAALAVVMILTLSGAASAPPPPPASCAEQVRDEQARLPRIADETRRRELDLLLDKAGKEAAAGRERLCLDALTRAQSLDH